MKKNNSLKNYFQPANARELNHQYQIIMVEGEDAEKYLQGQLTCDVLKLADGEQTLTAHCDPKGKMSALFRLYKEKTNTFFIIIRRELMPDALNNLKKYAVFSKINFIEDNDFSILATTDENLYKNYNYFPRFKLESIENMPPRFLIWLKSNDIVIKAEADNGEWDLMDIQRGIPILTKPNQLEHIPQATNLQMIEKAISFSKGCYIGQETVARAKYRGANKRAMFTFKGETTQPITVQLGGAIEMQLGENWKSTGTILSAAQTNTQLWLQVILNKDINPDTAFRLNETELFIQPLPYTLEST